MVVRVGLTRLGSVSHVDLSTLVNRLNRAQQEYQFSVTDPVDILGDHDEHAQYPLAQLVGLACMRLAPPLDCIVGVTSAPITGGYFSDVVPARKAILVSTHDMQVFVRNADRTFEDYVILELAANLAAFEYADSYPDEFEQGYCVPPWHLETRRCLFDYCINRQDIVEKIKDARIDDVCTGKWRERNLSESKLVAAVGFVKEAMKTPFRRVVERVFNSPVVSVMLGGFVFTGLSQVLRNAYGSGAEVFLFFFVALGLGTAIVIRYLKSWRRGKTRLKT